MTPDAIGGVNKTVIPPAPGAVKPATTAPVEAGPTTEADASWVSKAGDMLSSAATAVTPSMETMASIATAASVPFMGLGSLIGQAVKFWSKASAAKTQAFLDANLAKFSPAGQATLKQLASAGKLDAVDPGWNTLRDNLDAFLRGGGDPKVAEQVLGQIARPESTIAQAREHACVAAAYQIGIARDNPAQYFQMMTQLAATGEAKLPNGDTMKVSAKNLAWIDAQNLSPQDRLDAIFQAALMDYASDGGYDMEKDLVTTREEDKNMTSVMHGLRPSQARKLNEALLGCPAIDAADVVKGWFSGIFGPSQTREEVLKAAIVSSLEDAKEDGHGGVMVVVNAGTETIELPPVLRGMIPDEEWKVQRYHMVVVKDVTDGVVTYLDPTGQTRKESLDDFVKKICTDESVYVGAGGGYGSGSGGGRR